MGLTTHALTEISDLGNLYVVNANFQNHNNTIKKEHFILGWLKELKNRRFMKGIHPLGPYSVQSFGAA